RRNRDSVFRITLECSRVQRGSRPLLYVGCNSARRSLAVERFMHRRRNDLLDALAQPFRLFTTEFVLIRLDRVVNMNHDRRRIKHFADLVIKVKRADKTDGNDRVLQLPQHSEDTITKRPNSAVACATAFCKNNQADAAVERSFG